MPTGATISINDDEIWALINFHLDRESGDVKKGRYADAADERARAAYLRSLVTPKS